MRLANTEKAMYESSLDDLMSSLAEDNPDQPYEVVPHVIPVETSIVKDEMGMVEMGLVNYQCDINLTDVPEGFLLQRINSRNKVQSIRIRKGTKMYYSAPGWLHWIHHDFCMYPAIYIKGESWFIDIGFARYVDYQPNVNTIQVALIGQRVIKL